MKFLYLLIISVVMLWLHHLAVPALAIYDPLSVPNNKFGIHLITASGDESSPAATLVNSSGGDWGYVTILIERKDRDKSKWQSFFDDLRRRHLIPIIRLATQPIGAYWDRPYDGEENDWANFLDSLNWPTKNRYIVVYNEPNHAQEWGNAVDPADYAKSLDKTIIALKNANPDFFVLNAGLDASAPQKPPVYLDEGQFLKQMNEAVPGIFDHLDGWSSHSYPNPGFVGSPNGTGKGSVRTYQWESQYLTKLGVANALPVFITETGWKHSDGITTNWSLPSPDKVGQYFTDAFANAWNDPSIVAVSPFLLNYQEEPFANFSFKKYTGRPQSQKLLGVQYPDFYQQYYAITQIPKTAAHPIQSRTAKLIDGLVYPTIVPGQKYTIHLTFQNTGQSIWNDQSPVQLKFLHGEKELSAKVVDDNDNRKIEPGQNKTFYIDLTAPTNVHTVDLTVNLFDGNSQFDSPTVTFTTQLKDPVQLTIKANLKWKTNSTGQYFLTIASSIGSTIKNIFLNPTGQAAHFEDRLLLPDQEYDITIQKNFYQPKTIHQLIHSGNNLLDFGTLEPDIGSAILQPAELLKLLPFTN